MYICRLLAILISAAAILGYSNLLAETSANQQIIVNIGEISKAEILTVNKSVDGKHVSITMLVGSITNQVGKDLFLMLPFELHGMKIGEEENATVFGDEIYLKTISNERDFAKVRLELDFSSETDANQFDEMTFKVELR